MAKMKKCPVCNRSMKLENLGEHMTRVHPREKVEPEYTEKEEEELRAHEQRQKELRRPAGFLKVGVVVVVIIIVIAFILFLIQSSPPNSEQPPPGTPYKDFTLTDTDGNAVTLSDWEGEVMYIIFFKPGCPACKQYTEGILTLLYQDYGNQIKMLSVDIDIGDTNEELEAFKDNYSAEWQFALDTAGVKDLYNIGRIPSGILIDKQGYIIYSHTEAVPYYTIKDQIDHALTS